MITLQIKNLSADELQGMIAEAVDSAFKKRVEASFHNSSSGYLNRKEVAQNSV